MFENSSTNLIQKSEALALQEIGRLSNLYGEVLTKNEIIERIKEINKSIAMYDLLIESDTFTKLLSVTGLNLPKVKDRIYSSAIYLFSKLETNSNNKEIIKYIENAATLIFSWDQDISLKILEIIKDLENLINCKINSEIKSCTIQLIKKYKFRKEIYDFARQEIQKSNSTEAKYLASIAYIDKIGPLISIYEIFKSNLAENIKQLDIIISLISFTVNMLDIDSFSISHMIPSLLRSVIRKQGYKEEQILSMKTNEIVYLAAKDVVGKKVIGLACTIATQDKNTLTSSITGEKLYYEFLYNNFWKKLEYLPELSLLEYINKVSKIKEDVNVPKDIKPKLYSKAGELGEILYGG